MSHSNSTSQKTLVWRRCLVLPRRRPRPHRQHIITRPRDGFTINDGRRTRNAGSVESIGCRLVFALARPAVVEVRSGVFQRGTVESILGARFVQIGRGRVLVER